MYSSRIYSRPVRAFRPYDQSSSCSSTPLDSSFGQIESELVKCRFSIAAHQFAHRLVPAYLDKTQIVGIHSLDSANHWIGLISLWIEGQALFLPNNIDTQDLRHLLKVLDDYKQGLERNCKLSTETCREHAQITISEIQAKLSTQNTLYIPLGYRGGALSGGHAIPFKLRNRGKHVEGVFLNLGEGVKLHPHVGWSPSGPRFHFQSFPVLIAKSTLGSLRCEEVFTRLAHLQVDPFNSDLAHYSSKDVYGPIYSLGTVQSSFDSTVAHRSSKPQLGEICGDMAITMLIKDLLIDLGYQKKDLHLLFSLEKLCDILFFYHHLKKEGGCLDEWTLLKHGLNEFCIRKLKEDQALFSEVEFQFLHDLFNSLFVDTNKQIDQLKKVTIPSNILLEAQDLTLNTFKTQEEEQLKPVTYFYSSLQIEEMKEGWTTPEIDDLTPDQIKTTLSDWVKIANKPKRRIRDWIKAHQFIYRALTSLPIPHSTQEDFWDQIAQEEISEIINSLAALIAIGVRASGEDALVYRNALIISISYCITDCLVRRKYPSYFAGFASPFYPSRSELSYVGPHESGCKTLKTKGIFFDFQLLPLENANRCWSQIRAYFEAQQATSKYTLFALDHSDLDIFDGLKNFHTHSRLPWSPVQQHLKFLEPFLKEGFPDSDGFSAQEQFTQLWLNSDDQYIPADIEMLYYLAYQSRTSFIKYNLYRDPHKRLPREKTPNGLSVPMIPRGRSVDENDVQSLGIKLHYFSRYLRQKKMSENQSQCLNMSTIKGLEPLWTLQLHREWSRIFSNPSLQISSLIEWIDNHLFLLSYTDIQDLVSLALFAPALLSNKLEEEPTTLDQLRELIERALNYHTDPSFNEETFLFLLRTGICLESYAPHRSFKRLKIYETLLLSRVPKATNLSAIYDHLLFLYQRALPQHEVSFKELIKAHFWLCFHEVDREQLPLWLLYETDAPLERYQAFGMKCCDDKKWLENLCAELFSMLLDDSPLPQEECEGLYPLLTKGEYTINVEEGSIHRASEQLLYLNQAHHFYFHSSNKKRLVWVGIEGLSSNSGLEKIEATKDNSHVIKRKFPNLEGHSQSWFTHITLPRDFLGISALEIKESYDHWQSPDAIVICQRQSDQPLYIAIKENADYSIFKILPNGKLGPILVNILEKSHPLATWFIRLGAQKEACIWINRTSGVIEEIEFLDLDLLFTRSQDRFYSREYPQFFLAAEQSLEELTSFTGGLVLENEKDKCLILPVHELHRDDQNFSTTVSFKNQAIHRGQKYFIYQIDPIRGTLVHSQPEAYLFLVSLFALQRNYEEALFYLARARSFSFHQCEHAWVIGLLTSTRDNSPEALLFYLRFSLHMIDNSSQIVLDGYDSRTHGWGYPTNYSPFSHKWVANKFLNYLRIHSTQEISRISSSTRLSKEEEIILLEYVRKDPEVVKQYWEGALSIRLSLLEEQRWSGKCLPLTYSLHFSAFTLNSRRDIPHTFQIYPPLTSRPPVPLKDFVRLDIHELKEHFIELYERISDGKGEIDLFYLSRSPFDEHTFAYSMVLHCVYKYPQAFKSLRFGEDPDINQAVLKQIISIATQKYAPMQKTASTIEEVWKHNSLFFNYSKSIEFCLTPPFPSFIKLSWQIAESKLQTLHALQNGLFIHFEKLWFTSSQKAILPCNRPFAFADINPLKESKAMQIWLRGLNEGYQKLLDPKHGQTIYTLKEGKEAKLCLEAAKHMLTTKRYELIGIKQKAEAIANTYPEIAYRLGLRKMSSNLAKITMEGILTKAYQRQNPQLLMEANPSLQPKEIERLIFNTVKYHILLTHIHQLERAVVELETNGSVQGFAQSLECHHTFNPVNNPEIILYQSLTGKTLRKQQAHLLSWELATTSEKPPPIRLFSAPAGDGKTTLYIPIAMKRLQRLGHVPFSISSKPLYFVDREGLRENSQHIFSFEIDVIELALNTEAKGSDFQWIYQQLCQHENTKGFKLTPDVYYALALKYQLALESKESESVKWLSQILFFLETRGAALADESRLNCSPFTQAKIGIGNPTSIDRTERVVILEIYRALLSDHISLPNGQSVKEVVALHKNKQAALNEEELSAVKRAVMYALANHALFNIPIQERPFVIRYWLSQGQESKWLKQIAGTQQAQAIDIVKIYFDELFKKSMSLVGQMQHVRSIRAGEQIHVPARSRQATRAYFDEPHITLIATIHGVIQQGLDKEQVKALLLELERRAKKEMGTSQEISQLESELGAWIGQKGIRLNHFACSELSQDEDFYQLIHHNQEAIFWYLQHILLKEVPSHSEHLIVTPIDFLHAFNSMTLFSADPGPQEIYGIFKKDQNIYENPLFLAHALHQFLTPENQTFITFSSLEHPLDFFNALIAWDPDVFSYLRMICDAGGTLRNFTVEEIVFGFFNLLKAHQEIDCDGVIIFEESSNKEAETDLLLWLKGWNKPKVLKGHDVPQAIQQLGLNWKELNLLTIVDPSHRVGANIEQPKGSSILILLGENLTLSDALQGTLRGRGVLAGHQRIIWGAERRLAQTIADDISVKKSLEWEMRNEMNSIDQEIVLSAYQQIDYHLATAAWRAIKKEINDPGQQIKLWHKYRKGLVRQATYDLIKRFKNQPIGCSSETLLWTYARERYALFGYSTSWEKASSMHRRLEPVITTVKTRIPQLPANASFDPMRQTHVHTFQKEEIKTESITDSHPDIKPESFSPLPERLTIDRVDFMMQLIPYCQQASTLFHSTGLTSNLWFTNNAIYTAKSRNVSLKENYIKPIQYIFIINEAEEWYAFALADGEAEWIQKQLQEISVPAFRCALLSGGGRLVQNGERGYGLFAEELVAPFIQDVTIDVGLTHCQLLHPLRFIDRIATWHDFWPMWNKIKAAQPLPHLMHAQQIEKHVPQHIKNYIQPETKPAKPSSLVDSFFKFFL